MTTPRLLNLARTTMLGATLACTGIVGADDGPDISYLSSTQYSYRVTLMPDIDQKRLGLPGNGSMYCVPTAVLNACAYAGNHGFADEVYCDDFWMAYYALNLFFDEVTAMDFAFGIAMATDAEDGTTGDNALTGATWAMGGGFFVVRYGIGNGSVPGFDDMAQAALNGALVVAVVGWYEDALFTERDGGHAMTVSKLQRLGDDRVLGVHDPASDESPDLLSSQSQFTREDYGIISELRFLGNVPVLMDRVIGLGGNDNIALIDAFYAFYPLHAYSWNGKNGLIEPWSLGWEVSEGIQFVTPGQLLDLDNDPYGNGLYSIVSVADVSSTIVKINPMDETHLELVEDFGITDLEVSRERRLYTANQNNELKCYRIRGETLELELEVVSPFDPDLIAFDNGRDELVTLDAGGGMVVVWDKELQNSTQYELGTDLPGEASMALSARSGMVWMATDALEALYGLNRETGVVTVLEHPAIENVQHLSVTPEGNLLFGDGSVSTCLTPQGELVPECPWAPIALGGPMLFPTHASNFDPATMLGPRFRNEEPDTWTESIPWCRADLNGDDGVGVDDLLILIAAWGSDDLAPDLDGSGVVDTDDLLQMLAAWGECL